MKQYEYRIIRIELDEKIPNDEKILRSLNEYGKEGWLVCSMNVEPRITADEKSIKVLLVREKPKRTKKLALEDAVGDNEFVEEVIKKIGNGS
ncbi:MAG: hypothetical protein ACM34K_09795 [Bacillota bacterium]